jgi:hypothetical protein
MRDSVDQLRVGFRLRPRTRAVVGRRGVEHVGVVGHGAPSRRHGSPPNAPGSLRTVHRIRGRQSRSGLRTLGR